MTPYPAPDVAHLCKLILPREALDEDASQRLGEKVRARVKARWRNAAIAHHLAPPGTVYVEGFLLSRLGGDSDPVLPHEHAFLLTPAGRVIDPTLAANATLADNGGYTVGEVYADPPASAKVQGAPGYGMRYTPRIVAAQEAAYLVMLKQGHESNEATLARVRAFLPHGAALYGREEWTNPWADIERARAEAGCTASG